MFYHTFTIFLSYPFLHKCKYTNSLRAAIRGYESTWPSSLQAYEAPSVIDSAWGTEGFWRSEPNSRCDQSLRDEEMENRVGVLTWIFLKDSNWTKNPNCLVCFCLSVNTRGEMSFEEGSRPVHQSANDQMKTPGCSSWFSFRIAVITTYHQPKPPLSVFFLVLDIFWGTVIIKYSKNSKNSCFFHSQGPICS